MFSESFKHWKEAEKIKAEANAKGKETLIWSA